MGDTQAAWLLLLMCASPRATFWLRSVSPDLTDVFAEHHDAHVWQCLQRIIGSSGSLETAKDTSSLPFLFGGLVDTTMVSPVRHDGTARPGAAERDGVALTQARRQKERTYPELVGEGGRARLVVLAAEVGGRWSEETAHFLRSLAKARSESSPFLQQNRVKAAYIRRWSGILACVAARSLALSLLERRLTPGTGADAPSVHEVLRDDRFA